MYPRPAFNLEQFRVLIVRVRQQLQMLVEFRKRVVLPLCTHPTRQPTHAAPWRFTLERDQGLLPPARLLPASWHAAPLRGGGREPAGDHCARMLHPPNQPHTSLRTPDSPKMQPRVSVTRFFRRGALRTWTPFFCQCFNSRPGRALDVNVTHSHWTCSGPLVTHMHRAGAKNLRAPSAWIARGAGRLRWGGRQRWANVV